MDCKFCEFSHLRPSLYDAPEVKKAHAVHIVTGLSIDDPKWDEKVKEAASFAA